MKAISLVIYTVFVLSVVGVRGTKIASQKSACPANCKTCRTGGAADGGKPVNSEGICEYFCSTGGNCGDGPYYKSGDDCRSCISEKCYGKEGVYVGCFVDDKNRDLKQGPNQYGYNQETCNTACQDYSFYALQDNGWCVCGNSYSTKPQYSRRSDSECGGLNGLGRSWRNSLYKTCSNSKDECRNTLQGRFSDVHCLEAANSGCCEEFPGSEERCPKMEFSLNSKFMSTHCAMACGLCSSKVPLNSKYAMVDFGTCESNGYEVVKSKDECGHAATDLSIKTIRNYTNVYEGKVDYMPSGCFYQNKLEVWFLPNGSPSLSCFSDDGRAYWECICRTFNLVKYEYAEATMFCQHSKAIEGRNKCMTDKECLDNARGQCDNDPGCFGVSWYPLHEYQKLRLCLSREMTETRDGWRTMMKSTTITEVTTTTRPKTTTEEVGGSRTDPDGSHGTGTEKLEGTPTILPPTTPEISTNKELPTIVEAVNAIKNLSSLASMFRFSGVVDMLNGPGPFTVFAPNNDAFSEIPEDKLADLLKPENFEILQFVLLRHIVAKHIMVSNAPKGETTLDTVEGEKITLNNEDGITIKSSMAKATVIKADVVASNGVVHIVDVVL